MEHFLMTDRLENIQIVIPFHLIILCAILPESGMNLNCR
jgi:hypothetical protein